MPPFVTIWDIKKRSEFGEQFPDITYFQRTYIHDDISNETQVPI